MPQEIREALGVKPRQQLHWSLSHDGTAIVRPQGKALDLFASLKPARAFPGREAERAGAMRGVARRAQGKGK